MVPLVRGELRWQRERPVFWEHEGNRAVRSGRWKLVSKYPEGWELYDIAADRVERNDLATKRPDLVRKLAAEWERWAARAHVDTWTGPTLSPWGDPIKAAKDQKE